MEDFTTDSTPSPAKDNKLYAMVAYVPFLCFLALFSPQSTEYTRQHGKQGLIIFVIEIIAMLMLLPIGAFIWKIILLACFICAVAGIVMAFSGKPFSIPFIGAWADKI